MNDSEKHDCSADVNNESGFGTYKCSRTGSLYEDGKWWCGQHVPSKVKARREALHKKAEQKWGERVAKRKKAAIAVNFHPRLVAMLTRPFQDAACESFVADLRAIGNLLYGKGYPSAAEAFRERADEIEALLAEIKEAENA